MHANRKHLSHSQPMVGGLCWVVLALGCSVTNSGPSSAATLLFIGNSFTFGRGSPVLAYRPGSVTDLNGSGIGGVPALFKSFAVQAAVPYEVSLETHPGVGLDWHIEHASGLVGGHPWDAVVLQSLSTLDEKEPGNPALLVKSVTTLVARLRAKNARVEVWLDATWPRADLVYVPGGAWFGKSIDAMARDIRAGYDAAAGAAGSAGAAAGGTGVSGVVGVGVVGVGEAWVRAVRAGVADANPYDGIEAGKLNLWTYDNYHASVYGYYLEALMLFGAVTGVDPRSLGTQECSGYELGLSTTQVGALERVAYEQLAADHEVRSEGSKPAHAVHPVTHPKPPALCAPPS